MYEAFDWVKYIVEKELVDVFATEVHDTKTSYQLATKKCQKLSEAIKSCQKLLKAVDDKFCLIRHKIKIQKRVTHP